MRCAVVRRAIRKKENVNIIFFDSEDKAFDFIEKDSENMFQNVLQETVDSCRIMEGGAASVYSFGSGIRGKWDWNVIAIP